MCLSKHNFPSPSGDNINSSKQSIVFLLGDSILKNRNVRNIVIHLGLNQASTGFSKETNISGFSSLLVIYCYFSTYIQTRFGKQTEWLQKYLYQFTLTCDGTWKPNKSLLKNPRYEIAALHLQIAFPKNKTKEKNPPKSNSKAWLSFTHLIWYSLIVIKISSLHQHK